MDDYYNLLRQQWTRILSGLGPNCIQVSQYAHDRIQVSQKGEEEINRLAAETNQLHEFVSRNTEREWEELN